MACFASSSATISGSFSFASSSSLSSKEGKADSCSASSATFCWSLESQSFTYASFTSSAAGFFCWGFSVWVSSIVFFGKFDDGYWGYFCSSVLISYSSSSISSVETCSLFFLGKMTTSGCGGSFDSSSEANYYLSPSYPFSTWSRSFDSSIRNYSSASECFSSSLTCDKCYLFRVSYLLNLSSPASISSSSSSFSTAICYWIKSRWTRSALSPFIPPAMTSSSSSTKSTS